MRIAALSQGRNPMHAKFLGAQIWRNRRYRSQGDQKVGNSRTKIYAALDKM
jgi:hypothetical protein